MTLNERFSGVLTPVVVPFDENLNPCGRRLARQCRWLDEQGVGIAVFGTNSEGNSLSVDEKISLLDQIVEGGTSPHQLMPGSGLCALTDTVRLAAHTVKLGCRGTLMLPPFFYKGVSDDGLFRSYAEVMERVGSDALRIYLYHIPPISQIGLSINLIERLIKAYPTVVVGIKDSSGDWQNTAAMLSAKWDDFRIFAGSEDFLLRTMQNGGAGCISATANVNPAAIVKLYENWQSENASLMQSELSALRGIVQQFPMIAALKATIARYANDQQWLRVRPPLLPLTNTQRSELLQQLEDFSFSMPGLEA